MALLAFTLTTPPAAPSRQGRIPCDSTLGPASAALNKRVQLSPERESAEQAQAGS
jgi:hypothetical protein